MFKELTEREIRYRRYLSSAGDVAVTREFGIPVIGEFRNDQACREAERFRFAGSPVRQFAGSPMTRLCRIA